jgi:hypothetical protein
VLHALEVPVVIQLDRGTKDRLRESVPGFHDQLLGAWAPDSTPGPMRLRTGDAAR